MNRATNFTLIVTLLVCVAALVASVYPGVLSDFRSYGACAAIFIGPVVAVVFVGEFFRYHKSGKLKNVRLPWLRLAVILLCLIGTYGVLKLYLPRRVAFAYSRPDFEQHVTQAEAGEVQTLEPDIRMGLYRIDRIAVDDRGGVFFRVYSGRDGIGPDTMSYGFAYQPNPEGTPFGAAYYRTFRLGDGWCWFRASDDWY